MAHRQLTHSTPSPEASRLVVRSWWPLRLGVSYDPAESRLPSREETRTDNSYAFAPTVISRRAR